MRGRIPKDYAVPIPHLRIAAGRDDARTEASLQTPRVQPALQHPTPASTAKKHKCHGHVMGVARESDGENECTVWDKVREMVEDSTVPWPIRRSYLVSACASR